MHSAEIKCKSLLTPFVPEQAPDKNLPESNRTGTQPPVDEEPAEAFVSSVNLVEEEHTSVDRKNIEPDPETAKKRGRGKRAREDSSDPGKDRSENSGVIASLPKLTQKRKRAKKDDVVENVDQRKEGTALYAGKLCDLERPVGRNCATSRSDFTRSVLVLRLS